MISHPHSGRRFLVYSSLVAGALASRAQPASATLPAKDEDVWLLSPFTVQTDVDYEATSSLAGTGLNTKLTDVGASVSVVTKFLEDTDSRNLGDLLFYRANMEARGFGGHLSGASPAVLIAEKSPVRIAPSGH